MEGGEVMDGIGAGFALVGVAVSWLLLFKWEVILGKIMAHRERVEQIRREGK